MRLTILLCILTVSLTAFDREEGIMVFKNGTYLVDFTSDEIEDYKIHIVENEFVIQGPNSIEGKIIQVGQEKYAFRVNGNLSNQSTDSIVRLINESFGEQCVEVKKVRRNKIFFRTTYVNNLHITVNEGVFIKKKDE